MVGVIISSPFGSGRSVFLYNDIPFTVLDRTTAKLVTISFDDLTITNNGTEFDNLPAPTFTPGGAKILDGSAARIAGKFYYEVTWTTVGGNTSGGICIAPYIQTYDQLNVNNGVDLTPINCPGGILLSGNGVIYAYGTNTGAIVPTTGQFQDGDVIGIAVDLDVRSVWFQCVAGPSANTNVWNGSSAGQPSAGTFGIPIQGSSLLKICPFMAFGAEVPGQPVTWTANFGKTPYQGTVPQHFSSFWPGPTTF